MPIHVRRSGDDWRVYPGEPSPQSESPPESRRLLVVPAVPSSGTSVVAGILHHLGVNMGNVSDKQTNRGYLMYEDLDVGMFNFSPSAPLDSLINQRIRFRQYCNYRFFKSPEGRLGVKTLPTIWLYDAQPWTFPIETLDVVRPLEDALKSDQLRMATKPERDGGESGFAWQHMLRYGGVASMHWAKQALFDWFPPKLTVPFYELLENPPKWIEAIVEAYGLEPTDRQMTMALLSVRPKMRTV